MKTIAALAVCLAVCTVSAAYTSKYRPSVTSLDPTTDFSKLKTYGWLDSHIIVDADLHEQIVSAIDKELRALGLTRVPAASADVFVTYSAYSRTDVNTKAKEIAKHVRPEYAVGILVVTVLAPQNMKTLLELRGSTPVDRASRAGAVVTTVADMFKLYPRRHHS